MPSMPIISSTPVLPTLADRDTLRAIRLLVWDFDGVWTDNRVLVLEDGTEGVMCNRSDGLGIGMLARAGLSMLVLSKETNPVVSARCRKLSVDCIQGIDDKASVLKNLAQTRGIELRHVAYVGNDLNDLPCMQLVGLPIAVADAWPAVLPAARFVTQRLGGHGAAREVCDWFLAALAPQQGL
jgi:YrbI family 3-deoxy-D-manno-octulosonate 8-phosphate phosphatase